MVRLPKIHALASAVKLVCSETAGRVAMHGVREPGEGRASHLVGKLLSLPHAAGRAGTGTQRAADVTQLIEDMRAKLGGP